MTKPPEPATPQAEHQDCTCSASLTSQPAAVADGETESREVESLQPSASNAQVTPVLLASSQSHPPSDRAGPPTCRHSVKKGPSSVLSSCLWVGGEMRVREGGSQTPLGGPPGSQGTLSPHCRGWGAAHFHHPQWRPPSSGAPPPQQCRPRQGPGAAGAWVHTNPTHEPTAVSPSAWPLGGTSPDAHGQRRGQTGGRVFCVTREWVLSGRGRERNPDTCSDGNGP